MPGAFHASLDQPVHNAVQVVWVAARAPVNHYWVVWHLQLLMIISAFIYMCGQDFFKTMNAGFAVLMT